MKIRQLKTTDAESYWSLRLEGLKENPEAFATSYEEAIKKENPLKRVVNNINSDGSFTFGAFDHDRLIGTVTLLQEKHQKLEHRANIVAMYVTLTRQRSGIGKALLSVAVEKACTIKEIEKINLSVVSTNENAKRLYTKLGFKTFGLEERAIKINNDYYDEEHMVLFL